MDDGATRIADAEARVARQEQIIAEMDRDKHPRAAAVSRFLLATMRRSLLAIKEATNLQGDRQI